MQVSCTCIVVDLWRVTPRLMRRTEGFGIEVRIVVRLPVGRLPIFHAMSSMMGLELKSASMMKSTLPSGAKRFLRSESVSACVPSVAIVFFLP